MNFYKHHLGDYAAATRHLSILEHGVYRLLIDVYYINEAPLPTDLRATQRLAGARTEEEKEAVEIVLNEFFILEDDGWHNRRCDAEIEAARQKAEHNREAGKLGGRPRKTETQTVSKNNPDGFDLGSENNPSHKPVTSKQQKHLLPTVVGDVGFDQFWLAYPRKVGKGAALAAWKKSKINGELPSVLAAIDSAKLTDQWRKDGGQFIPYPATWINQKRWLDEVAPATSSGQPSIFAGAA